MTLITFDFRKGDQSTPVDGTILAVPIKRVVTASFVAIPEAVTIQINGGIGSINLPPNEPDWAWIFKERFPHGDNRVVNIPDVARIEYTKLVDVNPSTFSPDAAPAEGWWQSLGGLIAKIETVDGKLIATQHNGITYEIPGPSADNISTNTSLTLLLENGLV